MMPRRKIGREPEACEIILDGSSPKELKTLHCPSCGFIVGQYYTRLRMIIASTTISPKNQGVGVIEGIEYKTPFITQCRNNNCRLRLHIRQV